MENFMVSDILVNEHVLKFIPDLMKSLFLTMGASDKIANWVYELMSVAVLFLLAYLLFLTFKYLVVSAVRKIASKTTTKWDDIFVENKVFLTLSYMVPPIFVHATISSVLSNDTLVVLVQKLAQLYILYILVKTIAKVQKSITQMYQQNEKTKNKPIQVIFQLVYVIAVFLAILAAVGIILNKPIGGLIAGIGAFTTIVMLIFKDSILGFVAGWQLSANDQLRIGDWITVPKYEADGDVIEMSLYSVKVRNFDNTITTIPPYALISESFQNWRGMQESKGRRIKRSIYIDINSVKFCDDRMLEKFSTIDYLKDYIEKTQASFKDETSKYPKSRYVPANARHQTNIGILRAYMEHYLKLNPEINDDLTCMVRQLGPSEKGLPMEVYCFVSNKEWVHYEKVQSDIFDHFIAMVPFFELRIFQYPTTMGILDGEISGK